MDIFVGFEMFLIIGSCACTVDLIIQNIHIGNRSQVNHGLSDLVVLYRTNKSMVDLISVKRGLNK